MLTAKEICDEMGAKDGGTYFSVGDYYPIIKSFGNILFSEDTGGWSGETFVFYKLKKGYGFLVYGWGSCSYCDALQRCGSVEDVQELMDALSDSMKRFKSLKAIKKYVAEKNWEIEWYGTEILNGKMIEFIKNYKGVSKEREKC